TDQPEFPSHVDEELLVVQVIRGKEKIAVEIGDLVVLAGDLQPEDRVLGEDVHAGGQDRVGDVEQPQELPDLAELVFFVEVVGEVVLPPVEDRVPGTPGGESQV